MEEFLITRQKRSDNSLHAIAYSSLQQVKRSYISSLSYSVLLNIVISISKLSITKQSHPLNVPSRSSRNKNRSILPERSNFIRESIILDREFSKGIQCQIDSNRRKRFTITEYQTSPRCLLDYAASNVYRQSAASISVSSNTC